MAYSKANIRGLFRCQFQDSVCVDRDRRLWRDVNPAISWTIDDEVLSWAIDLWLAISLTEREERVVRLRYGLDEGGQARTYKAVGLLTPRSPKYPTPGPSIQPERVRQILAKAHRALRWPGKIEILKGLVSVRYDTKRLMGLKDWELEE